MKNELLYLGRRLVFGSYAFGSDSRGQRKNGVRADIHNRAGNASRLSARQDESQSFALAKARRRSGQARLVDADLRKSLDDLLSEAVAF